MIANAAFQNAVLAKCDALKRAGFWPGEPRLRPRAWLANFDEADQPVAARLLDRFTLLGEKISDRMLVSAYDAISDGLPKGPASLHRDDLVRAAQDGAFTPVLGENPNPTDSGNLLCRKARQLLGVAEKDILTFDQALEEAYKGRPIVFIDDFVGSGDQFIATWDRQNSNAHSFAKAATATAFPALYLMLATTKAGQEKIHRRVPALAYCAAHMLDEHSTVFAADGSIEPQVDALLRKYAPRLTPKEDYIAKQPEFVRLGYRTAALMFGFEHSIPDSTLPIFWSAGTNSWEPLIERN